MIRRSFFVESTPNKKGKGPSDWQVKTARDLFTNAKLSRKLRSLIPWVRLQRRYFGVRCRPTHERRSHEKTGNRTGLTESGNRAGNPSDIQRRSLRGRPFNSWGGRGGGGWFWKKNSCKRLSEEKNCMEHKCNRELMGKKGKKNILPTILLEKKILDDPKSPTPTLKS